MKKKNLTMIIVLAIVAILLFWSVGQYNKLVTLDESVSTQWSNVENQYQRRMDLIPNLVNTVKGYATHEKETLTDVINARAKATSVNINSSEKLTSENLAKFQGAQDQLSGSLSRLLVSVERYPDLKANQNFLELQAQLEGTENRIAVERRRFNESAKSYNTKIRRFPTNIIAGFGNFDKKPYFKSVIGSEKAPVVKF